MRDRLLPDASVTGFLWALVVVPCLITWAVADDRYVRHDEPVFPEAGADSALVYFLRPSSQSMFPLELLAVIVDDQPVGWLPQRSYVVASIAPGRRLVWGQMDNGMEKFTFEPGRTYVMVLEEERLEKSRNLVATSWRFRSPAEIRDLVAERKLSWVTSTEPGVARLRREVAKDYARKLAKVRDPVARDLPAVFETVWYRRGDRGFSLKAYDASGVLSVSRDTIAFRSRNMALAIPTRDVSGATYGGFESRLPDPNQWAIVWFSRNGEPEIAAFLDGRRLGGGGNSEVIYLTIKSALSGMARTPETTDAPSPTPADTLAAPAVPDSGR